MWRQEASSRDCCRVQGQRLGEAVLLPRTAAAAYPFPPGNAGRGQELCSRSYLRQLAPGDLRGAIALHHDGGVGRGRLLGDGLLQQILVRLVADRVQPSLADFLVQPGLCSGEDQG